MTRLVFSATLAIVLICVVLGVSFLKDSYKILPIPSNATLKGAPFADWHDFTAPSGRFRIRLPVLPQHATQTIRDPKTGEVRNYDMYVAEKLNGSVFMVSLIRFPDSKEAPEMLKKSVVNDLLASNPSNQLKQMKVGQYNQFKTLDFSIVNNEMAIDGMTFVDGDTLYLISALFQNAFYNPEEYKYFSNSFNLIKK